MEKEKLSPEIVNEIYKRIKDDIDATYNNTYIDGDDSYGDLGMTTNSSIFLNGKTYSVKYDVSPYDSTCFRNITGIEINGNKYPLPSLDQKAFSDNAEKIKEGNSLEY